MHKASSIVTQVRIQKPELKTNTNSINDCNTSLVKDAIHRVSTDGLFVAFFFPIGIICLLHRNTVYY